MKKKLLCRVGPGLDLNYKDDLAKGEEVKKKLMELANNQEDKTSLLVSKDNYNNSNIEIELATNKTRRNANKYEALPKLENIITRQCYHFCIHALL